MKIEGARNTFQYYLKFIIWQEKMFVTRLHMPINLLWDCI